MKKLCLPKILLLIATIFLICIGVSFQKYPNDENSLSFLESDKNCNNALECYLEAIDTVKKMKTELLEMKEDLQKKFDQKEADLIKKYDEEKTKHETFVKQLKEQYQSDIRKYERKVTSFPKRVLIKTKENLCITFVKNMDDLFLKECNDDDNNQKWIIDPTVDMQDYLLNGAYRPTVWYTVHIFNINSSGFTYMSVTENYSNPIQAQTSSGKRNNMWTLNAVNYSNFDNLFTIMATNNNSPSGYLMKTKENKL
jgi:hypothetical protein